MRRMKKFLTLLLILVLISAFCVSALANEYVGFTDVPSDSWYAESVSWAVEQTVTTGTSATSFSPYDTCSNAEILTFLWRAYGSPDSAVENPFNDISSGSYFYKAALWSYLNEIVPEGVFQPDKPCTRGMAVQYMWAAAGSPATSTTSQFTDVHASDSYAQAVAWALNEGVTTGTSASAFSPNDICTRADIVTFLYRDIGQDADAPELSGVPEVPTVSEENDALELEANPEIVEESTVNSELEVNPEIVQESPTEDVVDNTSGGSYFDLDF